MKPLLCWLAVAAGLLLPASCSHPSPPSAHAAGPGGHPAEPRGHPANSPRARREVRVTGTIQAVHFSKVLVPPIFGQGGSLTLTRIIPNGSRVKEGDLIAEFDAAQQQDSARDAQAKFDDLGHQVDQKRAQNRADAEKRAADLKQADADLAKARIEVQKRPLLSQIDALKNEARAAIAARHVESLNKSNAFHDKSDGAALRILELQRDRQKVALERTQGNIAKMQVRAPLAGMVAHQNVYRNNSIGHPQEGDQLYRNQALLSIFDPSEMSVTCMVGEPDGAALVAGSRATVYLDAYPDLSFPAHFEFVSPVASSALGSPIKAFAAVFKLEKVDPHLMPDLSAAVVVEAPAPDSSAPGGVK